VAEWKRARRIPASRETEALKQHGSSHLAFVSLYYPVTRGKERGTTYDSCCRVPDGKLRDFIATSPRNARGINARMLAWVALASVSLYSARHGILLTIALPDGTFKYPPAFPDVTPPRELVVACRRGRAFLLLCFGSTIRRWWFLLFDSAILERYKGAFPVTRSCAKNYSPLRSLTILTDSDSNLRRFSFIRISGCGTTRSAIFVRENPRPWETSRKIAETLWEFKKKSSQQVLPSVVRSSESIPPFNHRMHRTLKGPRSSRGSILSRKSRFREILYYIQRLVNGALLGHAEWHAATRTGRFVEPRKDFLPLAGERLGMERGKWESTAAG